MMESRVTLKCHARFGERDRETRGLQYTKVRSVSTPLSPLLANIALDGLEEKLKKYIETFPGGKRNNRRTLGFVRYADDFVILHHDRNVISKCQEIVEEELAKMGLHLNLKKTRITHTLEEKGFNFLGFHVQQFVVGKHNSKQGFKTIITPSKSSIAKHYRQMSDIIDRHQAAPQKALISKLNPIKVGWTNYFKTVNSGKAFERLDSLLWNKLRRWAYRRHPNKSRGWIIKKYWGRRGNKNWSFQTDNLWLTLHAETKIVNYTKVIGGVSPFDGNSVYWSQRLSLYPDMPKQKVQLLKEQKGLCTQCGVMFLDGDIMEVHHIQPKGKGGNNKKGNLMLLHLHCHDNVHGTHDKSSFAEEPNKAKVLRSVLKTSIFGDKDA